MKKKLLCFVAAIAVSFNSFAVAQQKVNEVVIGVLEPLTGPVAQIGLDSIAAIKTAVQIINEKTDLDMPFAKTQGLPGLGGAKIRLVIADHQGKPEIGQGEAERLINNEKVHALFGAYFSSVTATASLVADRAGIPFVNGASTAPNLTDRGLKYFFRVTPHDGEFTKLMYDFVADLEKKNKIKIGSVSILHEDSLWGTDSGTAQEKLAKEKNYKVLDKIAYNSKATSLTSEVQKLKASNADVLLPSSYTSDAFLFLKTAKELDYNPKLLIAQNAGYTDPSFISTMGKDAEGVITRSPYNADLAKRIPNLAKVNELFKKNSGGRDLSDVPAREFTAFMVLIDAINRAGSTDPEKIRIALTQTNIPAKNLIVPYKGVKFNANGHNELQRGILMQVQNGQYCTIYPFELAACEVKYPMPTWAQKK
jgi:branched-chain amino acid transport system substrate-binding protein